MTRADSGDLPVRLLQGTPARAHACSRHRFHCIDLLSLELRGRLPLSSRTVGLIKARPAQAVTFRP